MNKSFELARRGKTTKQGISTQELIHANNSRSLRQQVFAAGW